MAEFRYLANKVSDDSITGTYPTNVYPLYPWGKNEDSNDLILDTHLPIEMDGFLFVR